jgi:acyl-ACP thioesterase
MIQKKQIPSDYSWTIKIASYDAGQDQRLRLSNQLKLQQEIGELHFEEADLSYQTIQSRGAVFLLTRLNSVIIRAPIFNEQVQVRTWHRDTKGVQFFRCYQFLDMDGQLLIDSVSAFAMVDPVEHKLLRPSEFAQFGVSQQPERRNSCPDPARLKLPEVMQPMGKRRIRWSDTDYNGHLNNTVYADILCDNLPGGMQGKRITGFSLSYLKEAKEGDVLELQAVEENGQVWMSGDHARGRCFDAWLSYEAE